MIRRIKSYKFILALFLAVALLAAPIGAAMAAVSPYCYVNTQGWTTDQIAADSAGFKTDLNAASNSNILVDVSSGGTGAYLNLQAYIDAVVAGTASLSDPASFQASHPATPPGNVAVVTAITAVTATTIAGTAPVLPATVIATMSDSTTQAVTVTWDTVAAYSYAAAGSFTVNGTIAGTTIKATANVTVSAAPVGPVAAVNTSVANAIPNLEGYYTEVKPDNVVILGNTAKVKAVALDAQGNPVSGASLTFAITSAKTVDQNESSDPDYVATALFGNGQETVSVITDSQGAAIVKLNATVKDQNNPTVSPNYIANEQDAAAQVAYTVSYNGDTVTNSGTVAFATLDQNLDTADNMWNMIHGNQNSWEYYPHSVDVDPNSPKNDGSSYEDYVTMVTYPFSQPDGQALAYDNEYAAAQDVSTATSSGSALDGSLKVEAPYIGLNIFDSQFNDTEYGDSRQTTKGLSHFVTLLKPNQTEVYTDQDDNMVIPNTVNYATLNFSNLSLSPGSAVSVYFVPLGGGAPTGAYTTDSRAYTQANGVALTNTADPGTYSAATGDASWVKTFFALPANNSDSSDYTGATPYVASNFGVQIPSSRQAGTVYVVLQTPGQIEPSTDTGYALDSITMNYGVESAPPAFFDYAKLSNYMTWDEATINYSSETLMTEDQINDLLYDGGSVVSASASESTVNDNQWGALSSWKYYYKVPVYPYVGNAVVKAYDGNGTLKMAWSVPTEIQLIDNGYGLNQNEITFAKPDAIKALANDAIEKSVGGIVSQDDGTAIIDSTKTGYTELKGTLDLGTDPYGDPYVPENYQNLLANYYAFGQWTPSAVPTPVPTPVDTTLTPGAQSYTLVGQRVEITAQVKDINGNLVENQVPVTFTVSASGDSSITARFHEHYYDPNEYNADVPANSYKTFTVYTDVHGIATIWLSAPMAAAAMVQASSDLGGQHYNVTLSDPDGYLDTKTNADGVVLPTQINFEKVKLMYVPEDTDFQPVTNGIDMSKAVVGKTQNFGIISVLEKPERDFDSNVPELKDGVFYEDINSFYNDAEKVEVAKAAIDVTSDGVGTVTPAETTTSTNENPQVDKYVDPTTGETLVNKYGVKHWSAISSAAGEQDISVTPSLDEWTGLALYLPDGTPLVNEGVGVPTGVNTLNIPVLWMASTAYAKLMTPVTGDYPEDTEVPVTVKVEDTNGNPIEGISVTFSNNFQSAPSMFLKYQGSQGDTFTVETDENGLATVYAVRGVNGDIQQVAINVFNESTGTDVYFKDGTPTASQVVNWGPAQTEITDLQINGTPQVDEELTASFDPADATVTYQWIISEDGTSYTNIDGATGSTYTPVAGDVDKQIGVIVKGTGDYTGTLTSALTAAVTAIPL